MEAYLLLRKNNSTIPDETLEFMKRVSLKAINEDKYYLYLILGYNNVYSYKEEYDDLEAE